MKNNCENEYYNEAYEIAKKFVETKSTIRKVANEVGMPKSTVHQRLKYFTEAPKKLLQDKILEEQARQLIEKNKKERSVRGGTATKIKFLNLKKKTR